MFDDTGGGATGVDSDLASPRAPAGRGGPAAPDAGDELAASAVEAMRSSVAVHAAADAVQLQAIATLAQVRRAQARADAEFRAERLRRDVPGTPRRPVRVDLDLVDRCTAQEVSVALWLSPVVARDRLQLALELVTDRPATFDALRTGAIDLVRARRIVDAVRSLHGEVLTGGGAAPADDSAGAPAVDPDEAADDAADPTGGPGVDAASAVEAEALYPGSVPGIAGLRPGRPASQLTPAQLTARLSRLVLRVAPRSAVLRTAEADARRGCSLRLLPDGMALLSLTGRMELLGAAFTRIDGTARALLAADDAGSDVTGAAGGTTAGADGTTAGVTSRVSDPDSARTLDQARVDVFLAAVLGHSSDLGQASGVQITMALVAPAATVLGGGDEAGELIGLGPVPAPLLRELAGDARWVRWVSDPLTGQVTDVGRRTYRPGAAVADAVRARDQRCRFPTCRRSARACDLDHVVPFPSGPTDRHNLGCLCRTHHLAKHCGGFRVRIDPDGTYVWTTPTGQTVIDTPASWGRRAGRGAESGHGPDGPDGPDAPDGA